jgi:hypothetical protein
MGIMRKRGNVVVDNNLIGIALEDIAPMGGEIWRVDKKPIFDHGSVIRCGIHSVKIHLRDSVSPHQSAYFDSVNDSVTDSPGSAATLPQPSADNVGRTMVSPIYVSDVTRTENWFLDFLDFREIEGVVRTVWKIAGSDSGTLDDEVISGSYWTDSDKMIGFKVTDIDINNYAPGGSDRFVWRTVAARPRIGSFMGQYSTSAVSGTLLLDQCKTPYKRDMHGKYYQ